jgi:alkaline phosphatase
MLFSACVAAPQQPLETPQAKNPRNIILVMGDGLGPQQLGILSAFGRIQPESDEGFRELAANSAIGVHLPFSEDSVVNDSACSATQLGSGCSCLPQQVGVDSHGAPCPSFIELAQKLGMKTGVVSDTRLTHATPASFSVHVENRGSEPEIAAKIAASGIDLLLSGGLSFFLPKDSAATLPADCAALKAPSVRADSNDLIRDFSTRGYSLVCSRRALRAASRLPLVGLFASNEMREAFSEGEGSEPTLEQMTASALELLDNPRGFALMVEAGQIDWAGHDNDVGWLLAEMRRADRMLRVINEFAERNPDTLVLVTGDHETGSFGFSYRKASEDEAPDAKRNGAHLHFADADDLRSVARARRSNRDTLREFFSLPSEKRSAETLSRLASHASGHPFSIDEAKHFLSCLDTTSKKPKVESSRCPLGAFYPYEDLNPAVLLGRPTSTRTSAVWGNGTHTSTPILVFARGPGADRFTGVQTSTELGARLIQSLPKP